MGQMMGGFGGGLLMLLVWLAGLGVLFLVVYQAVYLAVCRAMREADRTIAPLAQGRQETGGHQDSQL